MTTPPRTIWRWIWLGWLALFLLTETPAALWTYHANGTLSVTVWSVWFVGWTVWLLVAFLAVLSAHFADRGRHWWSSGRAVLIASLPVAAVILGKEVGMGKVWGWLKSKAGAVGTFIVKRGPLFTQVAGAAAIVWPQAGVIAAALGAVFGGGKAPDGKELTEAIGSLMVAGLGTWRAGVKALQVYRKWSASQPALPQ